MRSNTTAGQYRLALAVAVLVRGPMDLKSAAFFGIVGMALWTVLKTVVLVRAFSGATGGFIAASSLLSALVEFIAAVSLLVFFGVFYRSR